MTTTLYVSLGTIVALVIGALILARRKSGSTSTRWLVIAAVLMIVVGFAPRAVHIMEKGEARAQYEPKGRAAEARMREIEARRQDVDERIASNRAYSPEEALAFLDLMRRADLGWANLPDQVVSLMPILRRALKARIVDPNILVKPYPGETAAPLFLHFYRTKVRRSPHSSIEARDWKILLLLVENGADLSAPGAAPLADDLRTTATPLYNGLYIQLN